MINLFLFCGFVLAANAAATFHPYPRGYHIDVGIPLAKRVYNIETDINSGSRIAYGRPSPVANHPYLAGVLSDVYNSNFPSLSTASLLTNTKLVFAAHNWNNGQVFAYSATVVLGSETIFSGGSRIVTDKVEFHPQYDANTVANDIAIITIDSVTFFPNVIEPVALPVGNLQNNDFNGVWARAAGFGMIETFAIPEVRHEVDLQVISNEECRLFFPFNVIDSTICTSGAGNVGVCSGDSGGPLSVQIGDQRVLIGVTSFGSPGCGEDSAPSAFARVTHYVPWILEKL